MYHVGNIEIQMSSVSKHILKEFDLLSHLWSISKLQEANAGVFFHSYPFTHPSFLTQNFSLNLIYIWLSWMTNRLQSATYHHPFSAMLSMGARDLNLGPHA